MTDLKQEVEDILKEIDEARQECLDIMKKYEVEVAEEDCPACEWNARIKAALLGLMDEVAKLNGTYGD